ncbi:MAG: Lar family restriction alleviation protein [Oscillospiraceae bacterium]|nr:Lar family restriction alleviation protein [Oscillospiraceae bacterium]
MMIDRKEIRIINNTLKPCPFCGRYARIDMKFRTDGEPFYFVKCSNCGVKSRSTTEREAAWMNESPLIIAKRIWNTRAYEADPEDLTAPEPRRTIETRVYTNDKKEPLVEADPDVQESASE